MLHFVHRSYISSYLLINTEVKIDLSFSSNHGQIAYFLQCFRNQMSGSQNINRPPPAGCVSHPLHIQGLDFNFQTLLRQLNSKVQWKKVGGEFACNFKLRAKCQTLWISDVILRNSNPHFCSCIYLWNSDYYFF